MSWNDLLISICEIVLTAFASWASATLIAWLSNKLKNAKTQHYVMEAYDIVSSCVKYTYQTYVDSIKGTDLWTREAQQKALNTALEAAKAQLSEKTKSYITNNYGDLETYLVGLIEATIYDLKN